eukprot:746424-Hanusia_phi.AAC.5
MAARNGQETRHGRGGDSGGGDYVIRDENVLRLDVPMENAVPFNSSSLSFSASPPPLTVHVIHRLDELVPSKHQIKLSRSTVTDLNQNLGEGALTLLRYQTRYSLCIVDGKFNDLPHVAADKACY